VPDCAMHRSLWPEGVDLKRAEYCPACLAALTASP
jgi:predicted Zn-dependent protease